MHGWSDEFAAFRFPKGCGTETSLLEHFPAVVSQIGHESKVVVKRQRRNFLQANHIGVNLCDAFAQQISPVVPGGNRRRGLVVVVVVCTAAFYRIRRRNRKRRKVHFVRPPTVLRVGQQDVVAQDGKRAISVSGCERRRKGRGSQQMLDGDGDHC